MRTDLHKVLTERPRRGSDSRNLKTRACFKDYDPAGEDRYSLPKTGKMLMGSRDLGPHHESKDFTDNLGPLKRWLNTQVGRNWDSVYSEISRRSPTRTNKIIPCSILTSWVISTATPSLRSRRKGRRIYSMDGYAGQRELWPGDIYVDPKTHVLMRYQKRRASRPAM